MAEIESKDNRAADWIPAPGGVMEIYANMALIQWSLDDVRVRVAQLINSPDTANPGDTLIAIAQEKAAITMTWRGAKIMVGRLADAIAAYERVNGPIITEIKLPSSTSED